MTTKPPLPLGIRRVISWALLGLTFLIAVWLICLAFITLGRTYATDPDELGQLPVVIVVAKPGDTWWTLARSCDIDRRVAVEWLAHVAGADPAAQLRAGQTAATCEAS